MIWKTAWRLRFHPATQQYARRARRPASTPARRAPTELAPRSAPIAHPASMAQMAACAIALRRARADRWLVVALPVRVKRASPEPRKASQPEPSADRVPPSASRVAYQLRVRTATDPTSAPAEPETRSIRSARPAPPARNVLAENRPRQRQNASGYSRCTAIRNRAAPARRAASIA